MNDTQSESAFPVQDDKSLYAGYGLSKKELFAGMAMQGLLSNLSGLRKEGFKDSEIEEFAIIRANGLCKQLGIEQDNKN